MNIGVVLAAGKGKRFGSKTINKTTVKFLGKPLVRYSTDLFWETCDKVVVVVGNYSSDVIKAIGNDRRIIFAYQKKRLGTGHALKIAVGEIIERGLKPDCILVGYGDHMMFYTNKIIGNLTEVINKNNAAISMVTCEHSNPDSLVWGRIIRDETGCVNASIEQRDASQKQRQIKELNAGLYCFRWNFLKGAINKIEKSSVSGEYYLTDLVKIAVSDKKKVVAVKVPFKYVGLGINTPDELVKSQKLFKKTRNIKI